MRSRSIGKPLLIVLAGVLSLGVAPPPGDPDGGKPLAIEVPVAQPEARPQPKVQVEAQARARARAARRARSGAVSRDPDEPPPCEMARVTADRQPPPQTMPQMFDRMAQHMMQNPATGFMSFVDELSRMEESSLAGVTLTAAEERQAGRRARDEYLQRAAARGYRVVQDPETLGYLRALVETMAGHMKHRDRYPQIDLTLIDAPISDGQSFPGGFLVFTTALLDKEPDEATVAGVVAHELAHLDLGHLYGYARRSKALETPFPQSGQPGFGPGAGMPANFNQMFTRQMALLGLMMSPFRPEHETEADCTSVTWLYLEGYDPRALVGFFERMHERQRDQPDNPFFSFGRTHPYTLARRDAVLRRLDQLRRWRDRDDLGLYTANLRRLVPKGREPGGP